MKPAKSDDRRALADWFSGHAIGLSEVIRSYGADNGISHGELIGMVSNVMVAWTVVAMHESLREHLVT